MIRRGMTGVSSLLSALAAVAQYYTDYSSKERDRLPALLFHQETYTDRVGIDLEVACSLLLKRILK
jgi:hypothetical protein